MRSFGRCPASGSLLGSFSIPFLSISRIRVSEKFIYPGSFFVVVILSYLLVDLRLNGYL